MAVCLDLKKQCFDNFNEIVQTQHTMNLIQPACSREVKDAREEAIANLVTAEKRFKVLLDEKVAIMGKQAKESEDAVVELSR